MGKNRKLDFNLKIRNCSICIIMSRTYIMHLCQWFSAHLCQKGPHLKICKTRRRLQPKLLNGILARVQLRGDDANCREHREAAVVDFAFLSMDARSDWALVVKYNEPSGQLCQALSLQLNLSDSLVQSLSFPLPSQHLHMSLHTNLRPLTFYSRLCLGPNNCTEFH